MTNASCQSSRPVSLKARYVFPVAAEPIHHGAVTVESGLITDVGPARGKTVGVETVDLGNVAILPGLINAHTHLDLSHIEQPLGQQGTSMTDWIRSVIAHRRNASYSSSQAVSKGIQQSIALGTTTVADIVQPGWRPEDFADARLGIAAFLELIAPTSDRIEAAERLAVEHLETPGELLLGLSPHAPYTVHPRLLERLVELSAKSAAPLAMHLAESREELELLADGSGPFGRLLEETGAWQADSFGGRRPLDYLRLLAGAHRSLIIHGNYLDDEEIAFLGSNADRMSVVYCPRTHAHFAHAEYPLQRMLAAGVHVCLGTDSLASTPDLSVLSEMRAVARLHPRVDGATILKLSTINPAVALGIPTVTGTLSPGTQADLTIVALPDHREDDPHELLLNSNLPMTGRRWLGEA
jgi:cytosine/adenosine deaminase-related metal-dependent hydrolase